jgi:hypothetical protein
LVSLSIYGIYMQKVIEDAEDTNAPFDDVTHWVGNLSRKDTDSVERSTKRNTWWTFESDLLS